MMTKVTRLFAIALLGVALMQACSTSQPRDPNAPTVLELDQQELVVGESLYFYGKNFSEESYQRNYIHFDGMFTDDRGNQEEVSLSLSPIVEAIVNRKGEEVQRLRINRFGPFKNPFITSGRPGTFNGVIRAVVSDDNGDDYVDLQPRNFALTVGPSIEITEFQPLFADCGAPAVRALQGIAYRLWVKATGIAPNRFEYEIGKINDIPGISSFEHSFNSPVAEDFIGESEPVFFNPIPEGEQFYVTSIKVRAYDEEGNSAETALPLTVHRPLEIVYDGKRLVAERYEPMPVSGCIPGSIGTRVSYTETKSEFRQRTVSVTINQNWLRSSGRNLNRSWREGVSEGQTRSRSFGSSTSEEEAISESMNVNYNQSEANNVNFSESDGESWSWSMREGESNTEYADTMSDVYGSGSWKNTVSASAEGSVPFLAKASGKVTTSAGIKVGGRSGDSQGMAVRTSTERGYSTSGSSNESRSFGSATSESRGQSINNSYALSTNSSQSLSDSESLSSNRTWNLSESESSSEVVSESESIAQNLTVSSSSYDTITQSFSGFIPRSKYGIFYRQTTRWVRSAEVRTYNQCGIAQHVGELQFNEFTWAPDLAVAASCEDRAPPANLPEKACIITPCNG
jgi:hypothetical protein